MGWKGALIEPLIWAAGVAFGSGGVPPEVTAPQEILVLRPNDLGDLLTATPIFDALRRRFPKTRIIAGIGSWGRPIVANNPHIDEVVELDVPWNNKFVPNQSWGAAAQFLTSSPQILALRQRGGFDAGIDILGSHLGALTMLRLGVRFRVGIRGYRGGWSACQRYTNFSNDVHVSQAALNQAALLSVSDQPEARPQLFLTAVERDHAAVNWGIQRGGSCLRLLVGCGGGLPEKCFPPEDLGLVLLRLRDAFADHGRDIDIILVGGPSDIERAAKVQLICQDGARSFCGKLALRDTFALVEQADFVLTNSSMVLHAAAAFRRPTLAVLGGLNSDRDAHDRLWGYSQPYQSIGPIEKLRWPSGEEVLNRLGNIMITKY